MDQMVRDFRGEKIRIECDEQDVPRVIYDVLVAPFASDYEKGWMANSAIETHIKNY